MVIHSASGPTPRTTLCGDYFYNYFIRGLDILFDGQVCFISPPFAYVQLTNGSSYVLSAVFTDSQDQKICVTY